MSSVLRTLTDLRAGVADAADVNIAASGVRHTNALIDARINRAVTRWARMLAECGDDTYMLSATVNTATGTPANQYISVGATFMMVRGLTIYNGSRYITMHPADFAARQEYAEEQDTTGLPLYYKLGPSFFPFLSANSIRIFPYADAVYPITVTYIPPPPVLATGTDTVEVVAGGDEWIMNDAAMATLRTDGLADTPTYGALAMLNEKYEKDLRFTIGCRNPISKIDTRAMRRDARDRRRI